MSHYGRRDDFRDLTRSGRSLGERFLDYLRTRSAETWVFFAAGFVVAAIVT